MRAKYRRFRFWYRIPKFWRWVSVVVLALAGLGVCGALFVVALDLPSPTKLRSAENYAVSTQIFDRHGRLLYEIFSDQNRTPIALQELPPYVAQATIAIEDKNFYRHYGFDMVGIIRAVRNTLFKQKLQGGSTLTQQLVKVSLLTRERTLERKAKEAILTLAVEALYSKDAILEMYLNHIPYGGTAWGIEAAAQTFFDKPAKDLTLAEAAYLAGLPQSPSRYSPFGNTPELGFERQKEVLRRMTEDKVITPEQAEQAAREKLAFSSKRFSIEAPHFVFYVRDQLVEKYGQAVVERGGLRVTTTLDLDIQRAAQASLSAEINTLQRYRVGNGAALVTKPKTGEVLAMVGSRDYFDATHEGQINMAVRLRQPGSSIKPLDVATAYQLRRLTPASMLLDIPTCFENIGQKDYCPKNYDGTYHGPLQTRQALANSYNIPAVKTLLLNSLENFAATASAMGISTFADTSRFGPSLALGAGEVTMTDMATAFGSLANQGVKVPLVGITRVTTYDGRTLYEQAPDKRAELVDKEDFLARTDDATTRPIPPLRISQNPDDIYRVLDKEVAWLVSDIMSDNGARSAAFGTNSQLSIRNHKVAAKTGTTNDLRDNWTVGFTPEFLTIVWVGNADNSAMNQSLVSGVTGAAPIWHDIMSHLLKTFPTVNDGWPQQPETIVAAAFCKRSGALPSPTTPSDRACEMGTELFWKGTEPQTEENVWHGTWIVGQTGLPPRTPADPTDQLRFEEHILLSDPFTRDYCVTCTRQVIDTVDENGQPVRKPVEEVYRVTAERLFEIANGWLAIPVTTLEE